MDLSRLLAASSLALQDTLTPADASFAFSQVPRAQVPSAASSKRGHLPVVKAKPKRPGRKQAVPAVETSPKRKRTRKLSQNQMARWIEKEAEDSQIYNLTLDVNDLRQQVQNYLIQKSVHSTRMLVARQNFSGGAMRTADFFFDIFKHGLRDFSPEKQAFVISNTDDMCALGTAAYGRHHLLEQWERYTRLFHMRWFVNYSMSIMSADPECVIVKCVGEFEGRLSRETIEAVFPHILCDEKLFERVVGCRIVCPVQTLLYFDPAGRIVRYDAHVDIFEGLNRLLASNLMDVITLMARARINDASMLPDGPEPDQVNIVTPEGSPPTSPYLSSDEDDSSDGGNRQSVEYILS
uniref:Uncharacterized protein n=1 Tax=Globisporangium ultimum (strain ATCC 200006 / CBS 805.95 / DAOM BR144) TaxID=431595 RepID=K3WFZ3_GLOUD